MIHHRVCNVTISLALFAGGKLYVGCSSGSLYLYSLNTQDVPATGELLPVREMPSSELAAEEVWCLA